MKREDYIDASRAAKMAKPGYVSITDKERLRMERLGRIRDAVEKYPHLVASYPPELIEVLPAVEVTRATQWVRHKRKCTHGRFS